VRRGRTERAGGGTIDRQILENRACMYWGWRYGVTDHLCCTLLLVDLAGMTSFLYEGSLVHGVSTIVLLFLRSGGGTRF
jgi:hypothetical protein